MRGAKSRRLFRVCHGEDGFVERGNPGNLTDGVESLWGYCAKNRSVRYRGLAKEDS
ncbi:hypothetical protein [uncultured Parolsenella sp.]|uniref:hypothetical protein n=1 Tax=uncultured Parolsenella sp. TaxID=2083008 RepID=UPI0027DD7094|nr:hypothetical protein [uncultured Parolsenella sp.]